jgi:hypothetical protein
MKTTTHLKLALIAATLALSACGSGRSSNVAPGASVQAAGAGAGSGGETTGQVSLEITVVPPGVQCIQINATGSTTVSQTFSVTPGAGTVGSLSLGELPIGQVAITGAAFNVACGSIAGAQPSWVADKQTVTIQGGVITSLTITFRPDNAVTGTANFVGNVVQVAEAYSEIQLVLSDGTVRAAGVVFNNGLISDPVFATVPGLSSVVQVALPPVPANQSVNFGWEYALLNNGTVESWGGWNSNGELGNGTTFTSASPSPVMNLTSVTQLVAGGNGQGGHACALESNDTLWCWGLNNYGQVGNAAATDAGPIPNVTAPVRVNYFAGVVSVAAGGTHTCALAVSGFFNLYCWGNNTFGQLGNNTTNSTTSPTNSTFVSAVVQVVLSQNSTCALHPDGSVSCWGENGDYYEVGIGSGTNYFATPQLLSLTNVQQLAAADNTFCARKSDGTVWCWGRGDLGQIGDGLVVTHSSPVQVRGLPASISITGGGENFCSTGADSTIECWGSNTYGLLGNNANQSAWVPQPIMP